MAEQVEAVEVECLRPPARGTLVGGPCQALPVDGAREMGGAGSHIGCQHVDPLAARLRRELGRYCVKRVPAAGPARGKLSRIEDIPSQLRWGRARPMRHGVSTCAGPGDGAIALSSPPPPARGREERCEREANPSQPQRRLNGRVLQGHRLHARGAGSRSKELRPYQMEASRRQSLVSRRGMSAKSYAQHSTSWRTPSLEAPRLSPRGTQRHRRPRGKHRPAGTCQAGPGGGERGRPRRGMRALVPLGAGLYRWEGGRGFALFMGEGLGGGVPCCILALPTC